MECFTKRFDVHLFLLKFDETTNPLRTRMLLVKMETDSVLCEVRTEAEETIEDLNSRLLRDKYRVYCALRDKCGKQDTLPICGKLQEILYMQDTAIGAEKKS